MTDSRTRIKNAVAKYINKNDPARIKKKNDNPERQLQIQVVKDLNDLGWSVDSVESKATFSQRAGRYISQSARPGMSDIIGSTPGGRSVFIELKAPGRRANIRYQQYEFLVEKIRKHAFGICADSLRYILDTYLAWSSHPDPVEFLLSELPRPASQNRELDLDSGDDRG